MKLRKISAVLLATLLCAALFITPAAANTTTYDFISPAGGASWAGVQSGVTVTGGTGGTPLVINAPAAGNSAWLDLRGQNLTLAHAATLNLNYNISGGDVIVWFVTDTEANSTHPFNDVFQGARISSILLADDRESGITGTGAVNIFRTESPGTLITSDYNLLGVIIQVMGSSGSRTINALNIGGTGGGGNNQPAPSPSPAAGASPSPGAPAQGNPKTADPGVAMIVMTGLAGLAGAGVLLTKKRK